MKHRNYLVIATLSLILSGCNVSEQTMSDQKKNDIEVWPQLKIEVKADPKVETKVANLLAQMTLEQKVAQMIQPEIRDITVEQMRKYGFGSYLNGGGAFPNNNKQSTPADWVQLAEDMYQASIDDSLDGVKIPTMWGTDAVHGHNNVVGATLFPHNIGLGAANNPKLLEKIAQITATEVMATGIDWIFAPTVATVRDDRWGRTYEGYSEDPEIVKTYSAAIVHGLQGRVGEDFLADDRVISTVKHFIGDGGTIGGDDQGNNVTSEQELFDIHAQGYVGGLTAGAQSVMASFNSWHGSKIHGDEYLLTTVLKERMGFDGLVVGDWNGHGQVAGCDNTSCPQSINAGVDIVMVPSDWQALYYNTIEQVKQGIIPQARIDDAVTRILRVKFRAGLFDKPSPAKRVFSGRTELIGAKAHRDVARQAVRESLVLLKNKGGLLPLNPKLNVLVAGDGADNIGKQSGGWSITWQGTNNSNADFPGGTSIYDGIRQQVNAAGGRATLSEQGEYQQKPDVAIVVFGEEPYAEGVGDISDLEYQKGDKEDLALLQRLKQQDIPVVALFITGRPLWVNAELNASDAFVSVWLPGSEGAGVAEVLFTDSAGHIQHDFSGKLTFSWPKDPYQTVNRYDEGDKPLLPYGFGLSYGDENVLPDDLEEKVNGDDEHLQVLNIHKQSLQKNWQMRLLSGKQSILVNANSHTLPGLSYRTIDKLIQEDAFLLTTSGALTAGVEIVSGKALPQISQVLSEKAVLTMDVYVEKMSQSDTQVVVSCGDDCKASININDELKWLPGKQWHRLTLGLDCLQSLAKEPDTLSVKLVTKGEMALGLSNIQLRQEVTNSQMICH